MGLCLEESKMWCVVLERVNNDHVNFTKDDRLLDFTGRQILDFSKLKKFADLNFKFNENGSKLSKRVENSVEKGEIARYDQFLLFPQCFQKVCFPEASKGVIVWEWVKTYPN